MKNHLEMILLCAVMVALSANMVNAFGVVPPISSSAATTPTSTLASSRSQRPVQLSSTATPLTSPLPSHLTEALKKPSKTLTVGMDVCFDESTAVRKGDVATLSMQIRKLKASTIWMSSNRAEEVLVVANEQATAQGNFPGACPIVWHGDVSMVLDNDAFLEAANAVVISPRDDAVEAVAEQCSKHKVGMIWRIGSLEDMTFVFKKDDSYNDAVGILLDAENKQFESLLEAASHHKDAIVIVSMPCMQAGNAEISRARSFPRGSVHSIVLQKAIVGDAEDVEYCTFAVAGLTGKQSSTFNMTGLTGSTNGHFGGVASGSATSKTWLRKQRAEQQ